MTRMQGARRNVNRVLSSPEAHTGRVGACGYADEDAEHVARKGDWPAFFLLKVAGGFWQTFFDFGDNRARRNKRIDAKLSTVLFG